MQIAETFQLNYKPKFVKFYLKLKSLLLFIPIIHFRDYLQKKRKMKNVISRYTRGCCQLMRAWELNQGEDFVVFPFNSFDLRKKVQVFVGKLISDFQTTKYV